MSELNEKKAALDAILRSCGSMAVAYSAGVDSTFLLKAARDALGDRVLAITVRSVFCPAREGDEAEAFCAREGIAHAVLTADVLSVPGVADNPPDRCYLCKKALFTMMSETARERGMGCLAEGSNMDDLADYRPGMRAVAELGVRSPLREAGLYKSEIRQLSRELGLPTWDKPAYACLASRIANRERITPEKLSMTERAEDYLGSLGFRQRRVRLHGTLARIEVEPEQLPRLTEPDTAGKIDAYFRSLGYSFVTADLGGYRMGSMNPKT